MSLCSPFASLPGWLVFIVLIYMKIAHPRNLFPVGQKSAFRCQFAKLTMSYLQQLLYIRSYAIGESE